MDNLDEKKSWVPIWTAEIVRTFAQTVHEIIFDFPLGELSFAFLKVNSL